MATLRVNQLAAQLNLTDAQKASAITIFTNADTRGPDGSDQLADRPAVSDGGREGERHARQSRVSATIGTLQGQLTAINANAQAAFYALLTAAQQTLYDAMPQGGPGGRGGPGGPGGLEDLAVRG